MATSSFYGNNPPPAHLIEAEDLLQEATAKLEAIQGSEESASASAVAAATSEANATAAASTVLANVSAAQTAATNASTHASNAATSASDAQSRAAIAEDASEAAVSAKTAAEAARDATVTSSEQINAALAGKADATIAPIGSTDTRPIEAWVAKAIDRPSLSDDGPFYISHRGSSLLAPENTLDAYRAAYAAGSRHLEMDCFLLADGGIAVIHDDTVDRTTTGTGNVAALNSLQFRSLTIDAGTQMGGGWADTLTPPLLVDILSEFAGKVVLWPEAKNTGAGQKIVDALQRYGVATDQAVVCSGFLEELVPATAAGYPTLFLTGSTTYMEAAWSQGVRWVTLSAALSPTIAQAYLARGFKVIMYTVNRRWLRDDWLAVGVHGFFSDDPLYLSGSLPVRTSDQFTLQAWQPGMLEPTDSLGSNRGRFVSPDAWGFTATTVAYRGILMGGMCPIKGQAAANDFTIYFKAKFNSASATDRWFSVFIADDSMKDRPYTDAGASTENGYHILLRKAGQMQIYSRVAGVGTQRTNTATISIADGEEVSFKITVTPTAVSVSRLDASGNEAYTSTYTDATFRGGYFQIASNGVAGTIRQLFVV